MRILLLCWLLYSLPLPTLADAVSYDPLRLDGAVEPELIDLDVRDSARERTIPIRVYLPSQTGRRPVVLFSHGLGGDRTGYGYLGRHWGQRGYVAVFMQHPGSDSQVWQGARPLAAMRALKQAANVENTLARFEDVRVVLDTLAVWQGQEAHALAGRLDLAHVGMSGHSFGAVTTQGVAGQNPARGGRRFTDVRIQAALPMSPSSPRRGDVAAAFADVHLPWMLMTGTQDLARIGGQTVASRMAVYSALPPGDKYELVLFEAEHSAFSDRELAEGSAKSARNPQHHRAILALSTAFWDGYLKGDAAALTWLRGEGARSVLAEQDRWQMK